MEEVTYECPKCKKQMTSIVAKLCWCSECEIDMKPLIEKKDGGSKVPCSDGVISDVSTLEIINTAIGTATSIINMSDNEHVQSMAANIADSLIALTNVESI